RREKETKGEHSELRRRCKNGGNKLSKNLANFCNNLQSTSDAFKQSLDRRPIPLDSASTTFMQSLNRRVSSLTGDLNLLESMSFGTVSFEELLGHCNQIYKLNHSNLLHLHSHLQSLAYIPQVMELMILKRILWLKVVVVTVLNLSRHSLLFVMELHPTIWMLIHCILSNPCQLSRFEEAPSFLGLSEISLATLASGGPRKHDLLNSPPKLQFSFKVQNQETPSILNTVCEEERDEPKLYESSKLIHVSNEDYEILPSYMKTVAPWKGLKGDRMSCCWCA
ncbi:hypothetical protein SOVF_089220 isoform E, partial [Spinacia oleracea]